MRRTGKTTLLNFIYDQIVSKNKVFLDLENTLNRKYFEEDNYERIKTSFEFLGIDFNTIRKGLESVTPLSGRSEIIAGPVTVINDCYNANLDSVSKAVDFTDFLNWDGRKVYILGAMKELGRETEKYHSLLGEKLYQSNADAVFFFGDEIEESYRILYQQGFKGTIYHTTNYNDLKENVLNFICDGDLVLLKGSRSLSLERLLEPITRLSLKEELC